MPTEFKRIIQRESDGKLYLQLNIFLNETNINTVMPLKIINNKYIIISNFINDAHRKIIIDQLLKNELVFIDNDENICLTYNGLLPLL